ncbi:MAG: phosphatase PAP2 family protein [Pseudomonadota bacterium]
MKQSIRMATAAAAVLAASALTGLGVHADMPGKTEEERVQGEGYIGQLSKKLIAQGAHQRFAQGPKRRIADRRDRVFFWHEVALDSVAIDHTPDLDTGTPPLENGGPTRTSRALAMTQIAVFDALNAFTPAFEPYNEIRRARGNSASRDAAIAQAAHDVLAALYPGQTERLNELLEDDLDSIRENRNRIRRGRNVGRAAAEAILDERVGDGSEIPEPSFGDGGAVADGATTAFGTPVNGGTTLIGEWTADPNTPEFAGEFNLSLGAFWGAVEPFFLESGDQFRTPVPPAVSSLEYADDYIEVAEIGGAPSNVTIVSTGTEATRFIGNYWGYDGVPLIGVPPRVYNQIAAQIIDDEGPRAPLKVARLLAQVNVGLADTAIAAWDSKYFYNYWRPVVGIRTDDGNPNTVTAPEWDPVGTSVVNTEVFIRPTPPFPAYPSGHAAFGASMFEILRENFGDSTPFTFISDEYNGEGIDPFDPDTPRPLVPVRFSNFTEAQVENGDSRIFNGVHWQFDNTEGQAQGVRVSRFLLDEFDAFQPK